ncbi:MAG: DUF368 domain-containing protein [Peptococcaceae bacterium]|nr:DUF368 domain-containing protein [Peptococcaceae bacterium]
MNERGKTLLKGLCVGGSMLVPGVSGGSMAMILGIYNRLISAVSTFFRDVRGNAAFLGLFALGALVGLGLFARPLLKLIEIHPLPMRYFFIGAAAGSVPLVFRQARVCRFSWGAVIYPLLGLAVVGLLGLLPVTPEGAAVPPVFTGASWAGQIRLLLAGVIAAVALVLPGISVSYMLLVMGLYDQVMTAVGRPDFSLLCPLGLGVFLGVVLTTRLLEKAMTRFPQATYLIILGFLLGSAASLFPGLPSGAGLLSCPLMFLAGFGIILRLSAAA